MDADARVGAHSFHEHELIKAGFRKGATMTTHVETVIIGGGQAGLAVSYYLSQQDRPHIVLEQAAQARTGCACPDRRRIVPELGAWNDPAEVAPAL